MRRGWFLLGLSAALLVVAGFILARGPSAGSAPDVFSSPIHGGCYIKQNVCQFHVDPFTLNVASGQHLVAFQLQANGQTIYDFRTDVSNPPAGNYSPSFTARDFAATCGSTYTLNLLARDSGDSGFLNAGETTAFTCPASMPNTPTPGTPVPAGTPSPTHPPAATATRTPAATATHPPAATATPCGLTFSDVHPTDYFYTPVQYLACRGVISGYANGTFRPYNNTTRGQLSKIVVGAEGWPLNTTGGPHFTDVPPSDPFYSFIETAYNRGIISGYAGGTFRPGAYVTRGQLSKIIVGAQGWPPNTSGGPHFVDVPATNPFYAAIETAFHHGIISGYADGTFRWGNNATRGQIAKIVYGAVTTP